MFGFRIFKSVEGVNVPATEEGITIQINDTIRKDLIGNWSNSTALLCSHWEKLFCREHYSHIEGGELADQMTNAFEEADRRCRSDSNGE